MDMIKIGNILQSKRKELGKTQEEMAVESGINRFKILRLEKGKSRLKRVDLDAIARAYHIDGSELAKLCGYDSFPISTKRPDSQILVSADDLDFLLSIARGLTSPMNLNMIRDLLNHRKTKPAQQ